MSAPRPMCHWCSRLRADRNCEAFPRGIPSTIYWEAGEHRLSWPGDSGLQFVAVSEVAKAEVTALFGPPKRQRPLPRQPGVA